MAVPSSGALSMRGIRRELGTNNYNSSNTYSNISLEDMSEGVNGTINTANSSSNRPDGANPHAMSEFYAYDHDLSSVTAYTSSDMGVFNETCPVNGSVHTLNQTYYHSGSGTYPTAGDQCYSDSGGNNVLAAGYYVLGNSTSGAFNRNYIYINNAYGGVASGYPQSC